MRVIIKLLQSIKIKTEQSETVTWEIQAHWSILSEEMKKEKRGKKWGNALKVERPQRWWKIIRMNMWGGRMAAWRVLEMWALVCLLLDWFVLVVSHWWFEAMEGWELSHKISCQETPLKIVFPSKHAFVVGMLFYFYFSTISLKKSDFSNHTQ